MIVPSYWAEAKGRVRLGSRMLVVKRFGWSDEGEEAAQRHAEIRLAEAVARMEAGEKLRRLEWKVPYQGVDGLPIREEVVERIGEDVVTRNSYGARCLNTPRMVIADVDLESALKPHGMGWYWLAVWGLVMVLLLTGCKWWGIGLAWLAVLAAGSIKRVWARRRLVKAGGLEGVVEQRVQAFLATRPHWAVRAYRTPAGMRLVVTHAEYEAVTPEIEEFFRQLGVDPVYHQMCVSQRCYRARLSGKPWRMGIEARLRPRPGVWPVAKEHMPQRSAWVERYEVVAAGYAACEFWREYGSGQVAVAIQPTLLSHDRMSQIEMGLPLA